MPKISIISLLLILTASALPCCSTLNGQSEHEFSYKNIPVDKETARTGEGSTILFRGTPLPLSGIEVKAGETLRAVPLAKGDLSLVDIQESQDRKSVV